MTHTLDELEKLLKAGTPGKWSVTDEREILSVETRNDPIDGETYEERTLIAQGECSQNWGYIEWHNLADAALIVAAINALPGLIESAKRVEKLETRDRVLIDVASSLAAAISLLERGGKKAAASDKMFEQMLTDYRGSLNRARAALKGT
jgi:hypothetical protein